MGTRAVSGGDAGPTATSADPDVFHRALVLVAAVAGLVWAVAGPDSSDDARDELELQSPPDTPKHERPRASQRDHF